MCTLRRIKIKQDVAVSNYKLYFLAKYRYAVVKLINRTKYCLASLREPPILYTISKRISAYQIIAVIHVFVGFEKLTHLRFNCYPNSYSALAGEKCKTIHVPCTQTFKLKY